MTYRRPNIPTYEQRKVRTKPRIRAEYRELAKKDWNKMYRQFALDASDNGRCWWIYQHILLEFTHPIRNKKKRP
tara:strand:+ start:280 stop:501 length:222 start_codon:yes stop_codon:yes gene_type:complete